MKSIISGTIFFFVIFSSRVHSQDCCVWSEVFDSLECGIRQPFDQLLFNDIRSSNWTIGIDNRLSITYNNIDVTWWRVELPTTWSYFSRSVYYPYFSIAAGSSNSTWLTLNVTAYGYPSANIGVPLFDVNLQNDEDREKHSATYHNPKYQLN